jgi:hypothetical protein
MLQLLSTPTAEERMFRTPRHFKAILELYQTIGPHFECAAKDRCQRGRPVK